MLVAMDGTVLLVAQPSLGRSLGADVAQVQWTSTGYLVAVASLLVVAGRLGDRCGHLRLLVVGVLGFGAASAGIALAPTVGWVVGMRVVQGGFGALLQPATLALLRLAYPADRLGTPIAVRTSAIAVAAGTGPVLGGLLLEHLGWRSVFWINAPIALLIAALALVARPPTPAAGPGPAAAPGRLDLPGAVLLAAAPAVLVHALAEVPARGWTAPRTLLELALAAALTALFARHERRTAQPIVPRAVAGSAPVVASMAILLVTGAGLNGALFTATFYLQDTLRLGPLACGLRMLPLTGAMILGAPVAALALRRYGPRRCATAGTLLVVLGIGGLARFDPGTGLPFIAATAVLLGAGFATVMVTATGSVAGETPPGYAGVVSGLKQTAMNLGPTLGIAVAAGAAGSSGPATTPTALALAAVTALALVPARLLPGPPAGSPLAVVGGRPARRPGRWSGS
ncbi:MFS transporter [Streptacidiphilus sp. P02-A3a]|uniref:MFS transporter n=1 Tax=Streptacidiphilus sp. P02-A3a TaxID=2704468 RepID=UPI0015F97B87|nr:MFS transporter [Streptacidiphilus sp. P02-A3a]QMU73970.1 MFS transporter [Streptacidiphilus sp. P02-A3a]